jgi:hypothetical protein
VPQRWHRSSRRGRDKLPLSRVQTPIRIGTGLDGGHQASGIVSLHLASCTASLLVARARFHRRTFLLATVQNVASPMAIGTLKAPTTRRQTDRDLLANLRLNTLHAAPHPSHQSSLRSVLAFAIYLHYARNMRVTAAKPSLRPRNVNATPRASPSHLLVMLGHFRGRSSTAPGFDRYIHRRILFGQPNASPPTPIAVAL